MRVHMRIAELPKIKRRLILNDTPKFLCYHFLCYLGHSVKWNGKWNGNFGMEYGRCQNGMEWKISKMEWKTILHASILIPF